MRDVSNKTLMVLMVVALAVTVVGTMVGISKLGALGSRYALLSGAAVQGTGDINVQGTADINIVDAAINFSTGYVNPSCALGEANVDTSGGANHCWINITDPNGGELPAFDDYHQIQNNGTVRANVTVTLDEANAEAFLCEASGGCTSDVAAIRVKAVDAESGSCNGNLQDTYTQLASYNSKQEVVLCGDLLTENTNDEIKVYYNLTLPPDMPPGKKTVHVTYSASQADV